MEPLDGRKGLTSGWIFLIGLYLFKEIFSKGWEEGENCCWKLEGKDGVIFFTEIPPIGTTGWKEGVGLYLFKKIFFQRMGGRGKWLMEIGRMDV